MTAAVVRYLICTVQRSGSNHLCHLISQADGLGMRPYESRRFERLLRLIQDDFRAVDWSRTTPIQLFDSAFAASATPNGVAGFKVLWEHFRLTIARAIRSGTQRHLRIEDVERELAATTYFVWLRRRDRERQAISWNKALQSNGWRLEDQHAFQGQYIYDFPGIAHRLRQIRKDEAEWKRFFERCGVEPLTLYYEDYLLDPQGTIQLIANRLGVSLDGTVEPDALYKRQSDLLNEDWLRRYQRDSSGPLCRLRALARAGVSKDWWASCLSRIRLHR